MTTYDYLKEAKNDLAAVRDNMLQALLESQTRPESEWISSSDFAEINALDAKLTALIEKYAPEDKPFSFRDMLHSMKYRVLPEYRDLWGNDPEWDGMTDMAEIERLAREWGKTLEDLLEQVEQA